METKEPLAKFHANINVKGQLVIPKKDREVLGLERDDVVEIIVRTIEREDSRLRILGSAYVVVKLSSRGLITIPEEIRKALNITPNTVLEVLVIGFHKFNELITEKGKTILTQLNSRPFRIITPDEEEKLLKKSTAYYSYSISKS